MRNPAKITPAIEWWFAQGYFQGGPCDKRFFMASIFKADTAPKGKPSKPGFTLLLSLLDPQTGENHSLSQTDAATLELLCRTGKDRRSSGLDPVMVNSYLDELREYGPALPIKLQKTPVSFENGPLKIKWDHFSLSESGGSFRLSFRQPHNGKQCSFELTPQCQRITIEGSSGRFKALDYVTFPRLKLKGKSGGSPVRGEAWLDHQWGDFGGWFIDRPGGNRLLGWDWFGINLDNADDLLVMTHRDMQKDIPVAQFALLSRKKEYPRLLKDVELRPIRYWESKTTFIRYPIAWSIKIPSLKCELVFEPLADDQEIKTIGFMRAIWEGAGTVKGRLEGKRVSGRARLELFGYGFIFDYKDYAQRLIKRIDKSIEDFLPKEIGRKHLAKYAGPDCRSCDPSVYTRTLSLPLWDLMSRPGKHWRSIFNALMLEALGKSFIPYESLVAVIPELTHAGSLIIDDIEDGSKLRRKNKCIHLRYGLDTSLNAANTAYFLPYLVISDHPLLSDSQRLELFRIMVRQFSRAHLGQGQDIFWSKNMNINNLNRWLNNKTRGQILQMYAYKTAAIVEGIAESAAVIAQADAAVRKACASFGRKLGVAFQIIDDLNELSGLDKDNAAPGEDIFSGKLTYIMFTALTKLKGRDKRRLQMIVCSKKPSLSLINEGLRLVRASGAIEESHRFAKNLVETEWRSLSAHLAPSEPKTMLRLLCTKLLQINATSSDKKHER